MGQRGRKPNRDVRNTTVITRSLSLREVSAARRERERKKKSGPVDQLTGSGRLGHFRRLRPHQLHQRSTQMDEGRY